MYPSVYKLDINSIIKEKPCIIFGAGLNALRLLSDLITKGFKKNIICIVDNDKNKWNQKLFEIPIVSPENLIKYDYETNIIITPMKDCLKITYQLKNIGFNNLIFLDKDSGNAVSYALYQQSQCVSNRTKLEQIIAENEEKINSARKILSDKKSIDVFNAKIQSNFYGDHCKLEAMREPNQYYPEDIISLKTNEVYIDCGVFDGNTIIDFVNRTGGQYDFIIGFEPDEVMFQILKIQTLNYARCTIYNLGLHQGENEFYFSSKNDGSSKIVPEQTMNKIKTVSLDECLFDKYHPSFIKMDIEGAEYSALMGMKKIITRDEPTLAVSVYHKNNDIFEIPLLIKKLNPKYKIYIRHHYIISETVCYAICDNKGVNIAL